MDLYTQIGQNIMTTWLSLPFIYIINVFFMHIDHCRLESNFVSLEQSALRQVVVILCTIYYWTVVEKYYLLSLPWIVIVPRLTAATIFNTIGKQCPKQYSGAIPLGCLHCVNCPFKNSKQRGRALAFRGCGLWGSVGRPVWPDVCEVRDLHTSVLLHTAWETQS